MTEAKLIPALNKENLSHFSKTYVPSRLLLGPGPSNAHPEVLSALSLNPIGHLDEAYISLMSDGFKERALNTSGCAFEGPGPNKSLEGT